MNLKQLLFKAKYLLVITTITLSACGGSGGENTTDTTSGTDSSKTIVDETADANKKVLTKIPKPSEIPYIIKGTGADFDEKLPNPPESSNKYKTNNTRAALNLGIYATDLGYVVTYEKLQNAVEYLNGIRGLAEKLGVANAFKQQTVTRFQNNLSSVDSLTNIINEAMKKSDDYLKNDERNDIAALIFTGTFLEGLFISTELVANYPKDLLPEDARVQILIPLVRQILNQKEPLGELIKALKSLNDKPEEVNKLITDLEELYKMYEALKIEDKIKKNQGDLILSDETLKGITKKVNAIRTDLVN